MLLIIISEKTAKALCTLCYIMIIKICQLFQQLVWNVCVECFEKPAR